MVLYKTDEEIELIKQSCQLLSKTFGYIKQFIIPGVKTIEIDKKAEEFILNNGGTPSFKGYHGFPNALCISVNAQVVHGIPSDYEIKDGDIVSVDGGLILNGFHSDSAYTFEAGAVSSEKKLLLKITKEALYKGIGQAVEGNRIGDIGSTIQHHAESNGYSVVRELIGHGIGKNLHEDPEVPNFGKKGRGLQIRQGLVIAIEPMVNMGKKEIKQWKDGWTISTRDEKPSAHFEHTVAIRKGKTEVLTTFDYIEKNNN
ncbi:MAG: type I methionyl aminopeptidase [Bacteroidetes bacterium CG02_land_8_20_14_3_00_31_25]|nr:type I methionyl aminopeptidase [Bacteroidota bacterium]PIV57905.1 MAG: type I methionyl aminopeptidase [Bacteroidetes bacterium CG02_land_8_20_14_3_00_31_25]PIX32741.1 MAG: type I methionyl aminopeptidase [Bacteroidetes bacterium CG_4_8_14_3_um_filter_31_14]PIY02593.1 MAG: type I methionyl aminopeptidase [Bacteroidetes bacterium CG_4_10_14_3_um_filter_31_20]